MHEFFHAFEHAVSDAVSVGNERDGKHGGDRDCSAVRQIDQLYESFDFLALDASNCGEMPPAEFVESTITDPGMMY